MPRLHITDASGLARDVELGVDTVTIGRNPDNDIYLSDQAVSGRHAALRPGAAGIVIEDLRSTNGTLVNGRPVQSQRLQHGDDIVIGRNRLQYVEEALQPASPDRTTLLSADQINAELERRTATATARQPAAHRPSGGVSPRPDRPPPPPAARLHVESGASAGKDVPLSRPMTTIGKPGVQVAAITRRADGYYIVHVGGAGRPRLNDQQVDTQARKLAAGDVIELMGTRMRFATD